MMTMAAGKHRRGIEQVDDRVGRRGGPSLMRRVHHLVRRCARVSAIMSPPGGRVSPPGASPTWCSPILAAATRLGCRARGDAGLERFTYSDDRLAGAPRTGALLGALAVAGIAGDQAAARRGPAWPAAVTAATTFVALGGTSLARAVHGWRTW